MAAQYRAFAKLYIGQAAEDNDCAFGAGLIALLNGIQETGSLNRAAKDMHMAYSKAWKLMNSAEEQFGVKLIERDGARGSNLTEEGVRLVAAFNAVNQELTEYATRRLQEELSKRQ
ncbi:MAG: LysR family transcriptional regulator [Coriobacteriaceae bacterium]|nr:LysR family transcriptional regulator [Coriobacteriaceae bacterium]